MRTQIQHIHETNGVLARIYSLNVKVENPDDLKVVSSNVIHVSFGNIGNVEKNNIGPFGSNRDVQTGSQDNIQASSIHKLLNQKLMVESTGDLCKRFTDVQLVAITFQDRFGIVHGG